MTAGFSLIDAVGTRHCRAAEDARIVALVPSITELLFTLELGGQVVGRTTFCVHPRDQVANVPRVGGTKKVNLNRLRALEPTHVILNIDENTRGTAEEIASFVPHVVVTHPLAPRDNIELYRLLGAIFGREAAAEKLVRDFERAFASLAEAASGLPRRKVLYLIWRDPWMTVSRDTYISKTLALVNWQTVGHRESVRYPQLEPAGGVLREVDLVLFSSEPFPFKARHVSEFEERYRPQRARLEHIDGEMVSWYGSRAVHGLEYLLDYSAALIEAHLNRRSRPRFVP